MFRRITMLALTIVAIGSLLVGPEAMAQGRGGRGGGFGRGFGGGGGGGYRVVATEVVEVTAAEVTDAMETVSIAGLATA